MEGVGTLSLVSGDQDRRSGNHQDRSGNHPHSHRNDSSGFNGVLPGLMAGGLLGYLAGRARNSSIPIERSRVRRPFAWSRQRSYGTQIPTSPRSPNSFSNASNSTPQARQSQSQLRPEPTLPPYSHPRHHVTLPTASSPPPIPQNPARRWTCSFCMIALFGFIITIIIVASTMHPTQMTRKLIMGERYLEEVDGRWINSLSIAGASEVTGHIFTTRPRVGELIYLVPKRIQVNLNTGQYHYIVYNLLGGSTLDISWNFNSVFGLPPTMLIIRSNEAFEAWRMTGGIRTDMKIHEQIANIGQYSLTTTGDDNPEYYIIFLQTNVASQTSGTADFRITSNTYALTNPAPVASCKIGDGNCEFEFKPLQEPYYLLVVVPPTGDSYTMTVNYDQRKGAITAVFVALAVACVVCITVIAVSWCGSTVLYVLFMSIVESVYRVWLKMTNCCRGIGRRFSGSTSLVPSYYDDEYDPELGVGAERQPLLSPSAPLLDNENGSQPVVNGQPILSYNPSLYDLPRPAAPPPPYTPLDPNSDPTVPRHPSRGGPRPGT